MLGTLSRVSGHLSRLVNRALGGHPGQSICARVGLRFGTDCLFCRWIGRLTGDPRHCFHEINGYED